jgi:membrane protein YqaA with SNARE-associated domain
MIRYLQLSLADLSANVKNILYKVGLYGIFLKAFCASVFLDIEAKIFFLAGVFSGNSIQYVNHLEPVMVLIKSNRL